AEPNTSNCRPLRSTTEIACGGSWSRSGNGAARAKKTAASASIATYYTWGGWAVRRVRPGSPTLLVRWRSEIDMHRHRRKAVAEGVADRPDPAALAQDRERPTVQQRRVHRRILRREGRVDGDYVERAGPVPCREHDRAVVGGRGLVRHVGRRPEAGDV